MNTKALTDDTRISAMKELLPPQQLIDELPITPKATSTVLNARGAIQKILRGEDERLLVIAGPCSIHDIDAAFEYADRLLQQVEKHRNDLCIIMRVYFEKPRTTVGWKGLINDPGLDDSFRINDGLRLARSL